MSGEIKISNKNKKLKRIMKQNTTDKEISNAFNELDSNTKNQMKYDMHLVKEISNEIYNRNKYIERNELATEVIKTMRNSNFSINESDETYITGCINYLLETKQIKKDSRIWKFLKKGLSIFLLCVV
jgi:hypothetical protein